ncbi:hypothetical protein [Thalassolituus sp.]|uniref:hypothetical protein n=1 Tax=Thalassolituus sp. TaxID=2030822 RepID=UPI00351640A9
MTSHSRKYRRRLHALPAAIALLLFGVLWLFSHTSSAQVLLSAKTIDSWNRDCRHCRIEPHYDVILGEIIRMESRMGRALLSLNVDTEAGRPELSWKWSLDDYPEDVAGTMMRVTVNLASAAQGQTYRVHYVWNPSERTTHREMIDENEYIWVVSGLQQSPQRWYSIKRDVRQDLGRLLEKLPEDVMIVSLETGISEPDGRKVRSAGYIDQITMTYLPEPISLEPVATSD